MWTFNKWRPRLWSHMKYETGGKFIRKMINICVLSHFFVFSRIIFAFFCIFVSSRKDNSFLSHRYLCSLIFCVLALFLRSLAKIFVLSHFLRFRVIFASSRVFAFSHKDVFSHFLRSRIIFSILTKISVFSRIIFCVLTKIFLFLHFLHSLTLSFCVFLQFFCVVFSSKDICALTFFVFSQFFCILSPRYLCSLAFFFLVLSLALRQNAKKLRENAVSRENTKFFCKLRQKH